MTALPCWHSCGSMQIHRMMLSGRQQRSSTLKEEIMRVSALGTKCSMWHLFATAYVLSLPPQSMFPDKGPAELQHLTKRTLQPENQAGGGLKCTSCGHFIAGPVRCLLGPYPLRPPLAPSSQIWRPPGGIKWQGRWCGPCWQPSSLLKGKRSLCSKIKGIQKRRKKAAGAVRKRTERRRRWASLKQYDPAAYQRECGVSAADLRHAQMKPKPPEQCHLPINILGDGNCFPHTVKVLTFRTENHHGEMCVRIICERALNFSLYADLIFLSRWSTDDGTALLAFLWKYADTPYDAFWSSAEVVYTEGRDHESECTWHQVLHVALICHSKCAQPSATSMFPDKGPAELQHLTKRTLQPENQVGGSLKCTSCGHLIARTS